MPNRIIREGILGSRAVNSLSEHSELFYRRLMSIVDDYGRFEADPELIRARCFPRQLDRWPLTRVSQALAEVSKTPTEGGDPLVLIYDSGNKNYLEITNFGQRQRTPSKYPDPSARHLLDARRSIDGQMTDDCSPSRSRIRSRISESETDAEANAQTETPPCHIPPPPTPFKPPTPKPSANPSLRFQEFWSQYPVKDNRPITEGVFISLVTTENEAKVFECLKRYLASDRGARSPKNPANWLHDCARDDWESDWPKAQSALSKQQESVDQWDSL